MYSSQTEIHTQIDEEDENIYNSVLLLNSFYYYFGFMIVHLLSKQRQTICFGF